MSAMTRQADSGWLSIGSASLARIPIIGGFADRCHPSAGWFGRTTGADHPVRSDASDPDLDLVADVRSGRPQRALADADAVAAFRDEHAAAGERCASDRARDAVLAPA